jgi:hypothetical protein
MKLSNNTAIIAAHANTSTIKEKQQNRFQTDKPIMVPFM